VRLLSLSGSYYPPNGDYAGAPKSVIPYIIHNIIKHNINGVSQIISLVRFNRKAL
jgi:hypothetical protein